MIVKTSFGFLYLHKWQQARMTSVKLPFGEEGVLSGFQKKELQGYLVISGLDQRRDTSFQQGFCFSLWYMVLSSRDNIFYSLWFSMGSCNYVWSMFQFIELIYSNSSLMLVFMTTLEATCWRWYKVHCSWLQIKLCCVYPLIFGGLSIIAAFMTISVPKSINLLSGDVLQ